MAAQPNGDYTALVVQLHMAVDGTWYVYLDGTQEALPLMPATFVIRLWRHSSGILRGTIQLHGSDHWAPIQSNIRLEEMVRAWLAPGSIPPGNP